MEVKKTEFALEEVIKNEERLVEMLYDRQASSDALYHKNLIGFLSELKLRRDCDTHISQLTLSRSHHTVDEGTMGFHDYVDHYEEYPAFIDRVTTAANELTDRGGKLLSIGYPSEKLAVISYLKPVMKDD